MTAPKSCGTQRTFNFDEQLLADCNNMALTADDVNYIVYRYLQESGALDLPIMSWGLQQPFAEYMNPAYKFRPLLLQLHTRLRPQAAKESPRSNLIRTACVGVASRA